MQVTLPNDSREDQLLWKNSNSGNLSFMEAYVFKAGTC